jgi:photosystem II stability/assembly factor-like uncharacterized protein
MITSTLTDAVSGFASGSTVLYAARGSGLYRSSDGAASWQLLTANLLPDTTIAATAVAAIDDWVFVGSNGAILQSRNQGVDWSVSGLAAPAPLVTALAVSPAFAEDGVIAAATAEDGVFISSNYGQHWVPWNIGLIDYDVDCLCFSPHFKSDHSLFAGTQTGIFRSQNGGKSWQETAFPMDAAPVLSLAIHAGELFAGTESGLLFCSADAGDTWQPVPLLPTDPPQSIHALHAVESGLLILTERQLIHLQNEPTVLHSFGEQSALTMTTQQQQILVGLIDGQIQQFWMS